MSSLDISIIPGSALIEIERHLKTIKNRRTHGPQRKEAQVDILRFFRNEGSTSWPQLSRDEYNEVVRHCNVARIVGALWNIPGACKTDLANILTDTMLDWLTVANRAHVLTSLRKVIRGPLFDQCILRVLQRATAAELTDLMAIIDNSGSYYSMHELVFKGVTSAKVRAEILDIVRTKNACEVASSQIPQTVWQSRIKIVSDIDDTFISSGGTFPAGLDKRFPRGTVYPGVGAFYEELELSGRDSATREQMMAGFNRDAYLGNLVFLSARPHVYKDWVESREHTKYREWFNKLVLHCVPALLPGSLMQGVKLFLGSNVKGIGDKKVKSLVEYAALYPDYEFVFIGDNGQADVYVVDKLLKEHPQVKIKFAYFHQVQDVSRTYRFQQGGTDKIVFFSNYIEAANHAYTHGLISMTGLCRVTLKATEEFAKLEANLGEKN